MNTFIKNPVGGGGGVVFVQLCKLLHTNYVSVYAKILCFCVFQTSSQSLPSAAAPVPQQKCLQLSVLSVLVYLHFKRPELPLTRKSNQIPKISLAFSISVLLGLHYKRIYDGARCSSSSLHLTVISFGALALR